ncbi:hypothetical protein [Halorhabdus sp. CUG00001]|uniref:hypothetical protein n=1 Tax=Halorhabdus sp. CUG00001 TaxID=2600297 RepID=UPI00131C8585|nr:hypothetical protein [Halorhabdus sp. CUG00001]
MDHRMFNSNRREFTGKREFTSSSGNEYLAGQLSSRGFGTLVLTDDHTGSSTPTDTHLQKTIVHETGHLLGAGRADDGDRPFNIPNEVYSGNPGDETPEDVGYSGPNSLQWSVMSSGWNSPVNASPMNGVYVAFSIEELSTIEFQNVDSIGG